MPIIQYDLRELYACETKLSRDRVNFYKRIGKDKLLDKIRRAPIPTEYTQFEKKIFLEIIDGCHRAKALFHLGIRTINIEVVNNKPNLAQTGDSPIKLISLEELSLPKYEEYLRSMGMEPD